MNVIPHNITQPPMTGLLYTRTCTSCGKSVLVQQNFFGFTERPSGRHLFAAYGLNGNGHSTLKGILDSAAANFRCLRCHAKQWLQELYP